MVQPPAQPYRRLVHQAVSLRENGTLNGDGERVAPVAPRAINLPAGT